MINTENNPPVHQPRERAVPCGACGARVTGRRVGPRTMTWNPSGLCDRHEAQYTAATPPSQATLAAPLVGGVLWLVVHKAPNRRNRRHARPESTGPTFYIPKAQQQPAVNRPFVRKKATA